MSSDDRIKLSNGMRISVFVGLLAIFGQLAVVIWGASNLSARVGSIDEDVEDLVTTTRGIQTTVDQHAIELAKVGVRLDNINEKLND